MASIGSNSRLGATDLPRAAAELIVGIVSHNDSEAAAGVSTIVQEGVRQLASAQVVWADAKSSDDTMARARAAFAEGRLIDASPPMPADALTVPYHGIPGKARALHAILATARSLDARACVVIDAGARNLEPRWIEWLAGPVLAHDVDFVLARYERLPHEGALTKAIAYPLIRALYGQRLRQPAAAEFACSARLLRHFTDEDLWDGDAAQIGIDLWLTTSAASGDFRLAEAHLGVRAASADETLDLATTLSQVVGSLFIDLEQRAARWQRVRTSTPVQEFGDASPEAQSERSSIDVEHLIDSYRLGYRELRDLWTWVLPPKTIVELGALATAASERFVMADDLWARIVYDFAVGHRLRVLARDHLLRSLAPLYLGWLASFVRQVEASRSAAVDQRVEVLAESFEAQKPYLIARWRWPERFRT
jgi:hypothetical protein